MALAWTALGCGTPNAEYMGVFLQNGGQALAGVSAAEAYQLGQRLGFGRAPCESLPGETGNNTAMVEIAWTPEGAVADPRTQLWTLEQHDCSRQGHAFEGILHIQVEVAADGTATLTYNGYLRPEGEDFCGIGAVLTFDAAGNSMSETGEWCDGALEELGTELPVPDFIL